ncbi:MAG: 4a-hydroxytetrahydrobiopterin dehydratase [Chloroflexi bacterium]|nr:4a-hydroxytetrahydrobiopterin dehydratase [Chloroflexota bacterium]
MGKLSELEFVPLKAGEAPVSPVELEGYLAQLPEWEVITVGRENRLQRLFKFKNFAEALEFTLRVGKLAEEMNHHPALLTEWGQVTVTWWTHKIGGLHRNDFILAAKTGRLFSPE